MWKIQIWSNKCTSRYNATQIGLGYFCKHPDRKSDVMKCKCLNCPIYGGNL